MAVTLESLTLSRLQAQPYGYAETDTTNGLVSRRWTVRGLLTPAEWLSLLSIFDSWKTARSADPDTMISLSIGSTVTFSGSAAGLAWSNVECWFTSAPEGEAVGVYIRTSFDLVDATQALAVLLREQEKSRESSEANVPNYGTVTLTRASGTSPVITLTKPMDTRQDGPAVALTATGTSYVTGPLAAHKIREIEGYLTTGTFDDVLSWYDTTIAAVPAANSWFPVTAPTATAEVIISGGVKSTRYTVQLTALQIL